MHIGSKNSVPGNVQESDVYLSLAGMVANEQVQLVRYLLSVLGGDVAVQDDQSRSNKFICGRRCFSANKMTVKFPEGCVQQMFRRTFCLLACGLTLPHHDDRVEELVKVGSPVRVLLLVPFCVSVCLGNGVRCALAPAGGRRW